MPGVEALPIPPVDRDIRSPDRQEGRSLLAAIVYKRQRADYLRALRRADAGDPGSLGELLARAILNNLYRFIVPAVAGPARIVPLAALTTDGVSQAALRVAAARGRLQAVMGPDGQWRSSRNWVDDYVASRYRRNERE